MRSTLSQRFLSILLVFCLCLGLGSTALASDVVPETDPAETSEFDPTAVTAVEAPALESSDEETPGSDQAAFGDVLAGFGEAELLEAWTNDAVSAEQARTLINSQTLRPQKTGWTELDSVIGGIVKAGGSDAYSQLLYCYDYLVKNVSYNWEGYSYRTASIRSFDSFTKLNYLPNMHKDDHLVTAVSDDFANRTYHILVKKKGVCYDYGIALAVMARYIGLEAYVHTGTFTFEDTSLGRGHHGWTIIKLNGENYIFDAQRDARNYQYNKKTGYYFGIPKAKQHRYNESGNTDHNNALDASFLSMDTVQQSYDAKIVTSGTGTGTTTGAGTFKKNTRVTMTAAPAADSYFAGWFDRNGAALGTDTTLHFLLVGNTTITAKFEKKVQISATASRSGSVTGAGLYIPGQTATLTAVPASGKGFAGWYDANEKLVSEETTYSFTVSGSASYQALFAGDEFMDIPAGAWYEEYAVRGKNLGLVNGVTALKFDGQTAFTRAMAAVMLCRMDGKESETFEKPPFADLTKSWYVPGISWAYDAKVVKGVTNTEFQPDRAVTRQEFFTMVARYLAYKGYEISGDELSFTDSGSISEYAREPIAQLCATGLVGGYPDGSIKPTQTLTRAEGTKVMVLLAEYMETNPLTPAEEPPAAPEETPEG